MGLIAVIVAAWSLTGCTSNVERPTPTFSLPASDAPGRDDVVVIVVDSQGLTFEGEGGGARESLSFWGTPPDDAVSNLAAVLGRPSISSASDETVVDWGGLLLRIPVAEPTSAPSELPAMSWAVDVDADSVDAVSIETIDGVQVGWTFEAVQAATSAVPSSLSGVSWLTVGVSNGESSGARWAVRLDGSGDDLRVARLSAPAPSG